MIADDDGHGDDGGASRRKSHLHLCACDACCAFPGLDPGLRLLRPDGDGAVSWCHHPRPLLDLFQARGCRDPYCVFGLINFVSHCLWRELLGQRQGSPRRI